VGRPFGVQKDVGRKGVRRLLCVIVCCWATSASGQAPETTSPKGYVEGETHHLLRPCFTSPDLCKFLSSRLYKGREDYRNGSLRPGEEWRNDIIGRYGRAPVKKKKRKPMRRYRGVPAPSPARHASLQPALTQPSIDQSIKWVGYQPKGAFSRVFWLLSNIHQPVQVDRENALKVVIRFPKTSVASQQLLRPLDMGQMKGPIERVSATLSPTALTYEIQLKRPAQHLYRFEGPYLMVDFEN